MERVQYSDSEVIMTADTKIFPYKVNHIYIAPCMGSQFKPMLVYKHYIIYYRLYYYGACMPSPRLLSIQYSVHQLMFIFEAHNSY